MSSPYERSGSSRRHGAWSHWAPLVVTVTVATVGVAAWVWSQRNRDDDETDEREHALYQDLDYENADYGENPPYGASGPDSSRPPPPSFHDGELRSGEVGYGTTTNNNGSAEAAAASQASWGAQMSGALRRTPSPQQFFDSARKTVAAGVTAASTAVGSALAAIREEDKTAYADHETWSEEADAKKEPSRAAGGLGASSRKRRKTVAVVVSAESLGDDVDADGFHEHASILSHIPRQNNFSEVKLFILIYAPGLKDVSLDASTNLPPASLSSSFSNIEHIQAQSQGDETKSPLMSAADPAFNAVYSQALTLVEKESNVLPFSSPSGHAYILRHLHPDIIYLQESLAGDNGSVINQMQSWLRHDLILVVGAEGGHGGLADSESEAERPGGNKPENWWQREDRVGRGRGVIVVDSMRVHDDWARRVQGQE